MEGQIGALNGKVRGSDGSANELDATIDRLGRHIRVLCRMASATLVGVIAIWAIVIIIALHSRAWNELGDAQLERHRAEMRDVLLPNRQPTSVDARRREAR